MVPMTSILTSSATPLSIVVKLLAAPLNWTNVGDGCDAEEESPPVPPPVRFALLGYSCFQWPWNEKERESNIPQ